MPQIANKMLGNHLQGVRPYQRTRFASQGCLKFKIQEVSKRGKLKANFLGKFQHCVQQQARSFQLDAMFKSHMVQPKDAVDPTKENLAAYSFPCSLSIKLL